MTSNTPVNDQITDAVTQANPQDVSEAAAVAMGTIYQSMAHATGILYENAVAAQQQQNTLAQAATTQGIMQIYSLDTTAGAGDAELLPGQVRQNLAALENARTAADSLQLVDAVKLNLRSVLDSAGDFSFGVRSAAEAMQATLDEIGTTAHQDAMRTLQLAATAACLRAMIADPGQADAYARVLNEIRGLV